MIVINKKRIMFTLICITVGIAAFLSKNQYERKAIQTATLPVTNKIIVIDAGHGKPDERSRKQ